MRALLVGCAFLTLTVGWASQEAPEKTMRAPKAVRTPEMLFGEIADLLCTSEEPVAPVAAGAKCAPQESEEQSAASPAADPVRIPVDLAVVDGETGGMLALPTGVTLVRADGLDVPVAPPPPAKHADPGAPPPDPVPWVPGTAYATQRASVGFGVSIEAPDRYVADEGVYTGGGPVSGRATRLRLLAPLRHEAEVWLRVLDAAERPVSGARAVSAYLAGPEPEVVPGSPDEIPEEPELLSEDVVETDSYTTVRCRSGPSGVDGWTRVRGLPHLLDERFWIVASEGQREGFAGILLGAFGERIDAEVRLPDGPNHVERVWGCSSSLGFG